MERNGIRGGKMEGRGSSRPVRPGKILFLLMKRKESCARAGRGRGGESEWCFTFFKGIINSLSALVGRLSGLSRIV